MRQRELRLVLVVLVLVLGSVDHASMSSKISTMFSGSGVRSGTRGTVILSDLNTQDVFAWFRVPVVVADAEYLGAVGSSSMARGDLQVKACSSSCMCPCRMHTTEEAGNGELARRRAPEPEGVHGEVS